MISKIVLGTVQFGLDYGINNNLGRPSPLQVFEILDFAWEQGITMLDTAAVYGTSEELIGQYHKERNHRFDVVSKRHPEGDSGILNSVLERIKRTGVESLHGYHFHSFDALKQAYKSDVDAIKRIGVDGLVHKFGASVHSIEQMNALDAFPEITLVQIPFNLLDNNFMRLDAILSLKNRGVEVHTRSAFLQGLFFIDIDKLKESVRPLAKPLKALKNIASKHEIGIHQLALAYVVQQNHIDKVLIGVDSLQQLKSNLQALDVILPIEVVQQIESIEVDHPELLNPSNW